MCELIRPASARDVNQIIKIGKESFPYLKEPEQFFVDRFLKGNVFVYEVKGKVFGFIDFTVEDDTLYIEGIAVSVEYRGRGIGKSLLSYALDIARHLKMKKVRLMTLQTNTRALLLYQGLGFRVERTEDNVVYLVKFL